VFGAPTPEPPVLVPPPPVEVPQALFEEYAPLLYVPQEYVAAAEADGAGSAAPATNANSDMLSASICHFLFISLMRFRIISTTHLYLCTILLIF
jgi:hypothetical protein